MSEQQQPESAAARIARKWHEDEVEAVLESPEGNTAEWAADIDRRIEELTALIEAEYAAEQPVSQVSACCGAPMQRLGSEYRCIKCNEQCDPAVPVSQEQRVEVGPCEVCKYHWNLIVMPGDEHSIHCSNHPKNIKFATSF